MWLVPRALFAFLALPGVVGFLVPWLVVDGRMPPRGFDWRALALAAPGIVLLLWTVAAFYRQGRGTLAPWDPPRRLVATGVYGISRNPMYVAVLLILSGWAIGWQSAGLAGYAAAVAVAFHLRVLLHEEPYLARTFGDAWERYQQQVPRWIGLRRRIIDQDRAPSRE